MQAKFAFRDPMLLGARASLTQDSLVLSGWHWMTRYRRSIGLRDIVHVDAKAEKNLVIWLKHGEVIRLQIDEPEEWKNAIESVRSL